jgi:hypothetical protein
MIDIVRIALRRHSGEREAEATANWLCGYSYSLLQKCGGGGLGLGLPPLS